MKWNMPFVESRTFDTRLTKSALLPSYQTNATNKYQRPDYRQFKSNYPEESFHCLLKIIIPSYYGLIKFTNSMLF